MYELYVDVVFLLKLADRDFNFVHMFSCKARHLFFFNSNTARDLFSIDKEGNQVWVILQ